jgi:hypothetical protein
VLGGHISGLSVLVLVEGTAVLVLVAVQDIYGMAIAMLM